MTRVKKTVTYKDGFRLYDGLYESFLLFNPLLKKNTRYKLAKPTQSLEVALKQKYAQERTLGITEIRTKKRYEFLNQHQDQEEIFHKFVEWRKKTAKNSWRDQASWIKNYVLPFFIGHLNLNHPQMWFEYWEEFHKSLKRPIRNNTKVKGELATNSKDNIIRAANAYISYVEMYSKSGPIQRLPEFKHEDKGRRGIESVYSEFEIEAVYKKFIDKKELKHAQIWKVLANSGLRVSEALGLMSEFIVFNNVPADNKWIIQLLAGKTDVYGYILLKSQPLDSNKLLINGEAKRKPLKKKKNISPENNRIIPLIDKSVAQLLLELKKKAHDSSLIFYGCTYRDFYNSFVKIRSELKTLDSKDIHSVRHTYATKMVRLCDGNPNAVNKVLGHTDYRVTERYNHLAQEVEAEESNISFDGEIKPLKVG